MAKTPKAPNTFTLQQKTSLLFVSLSILVHVYHTCMGLVARKPVFGFTTKRVSNQSPQLQRLVRKLKFHLFTYDTFQKENNKGADQTARMRRLVCACVIRKSRRQVFSRRGPIMRRHMEFHLTP